MVFNRDEKREQKMRDEEREQNQLDGFANLNRYICAVLT